jgi:hypothetical protein
MSLYLNLCISMQFLCFKEPYVWIMYQFLCLDHVSVMLCISFYVPCLYVLGICYVVSMIYYMFSLWSTFYVSCINYCVSVSGNLVHTGLHGEIYHTGTCVSVISKESPWRNISYRFQKFSSCISSVISLLCKFLEFLQCCEILINIYRFLQLCFCNVVQNIQVPAILIIPQEIFWTDHAHQTKSGQISFKTF